MTKLYYAPVPGGPAAFTSAIAAGLHIEVEQVCCSTHKTASEVDFYTINPKGNVPCLVLDDGTILNENVAVLQYIADQVQSFSVCIFQTSLLTSLSSFQSTQNPGSIAPEWGTLDRWLVVNVLGFLNSEVHTAFKEICHGPNGDIKAEHQQKLCKKFAYLEKFVLKGQNFLVANKYSIADAYLFMLLKWDQKAGIDLSPFPELLALRERVAGPHEVVAAQQKVETNPSSI